VRDFYLSSHGRPWRGRSPRFVVEELCRIADRLGVGRFVFQDDNFMGPGRPGHERARAIAAEIRRRGLDIRYSICCRIDDARPETLEALKESGLCAVGMSIESGNQASLDLFEKGITTDRIDAALRVLEALELRGEVNMIFFDPYQTLDGIRRNLALLDRLRASAYLSYSDAFPFNELEPFPWSRVRARLGAEGLLDPVTGACVYRDAAVARLVTFVRRLSRRLPITFKRRLLFDALQDAPARHAGQGIVGSSLRVAEALRRWVGLTLLPRYVEAACDALEQDEDGAAGALLTLEASFARELAVVDGVGRVMHETLRSPAGTARASGSPA
jgi:hypothetical protein